MQSSVVYSAFCAVSRSVGAVLSVMEVSLASISAAQRAAPTLDKRQWLLKTKVQSSPNIPAFVNVKRTLAKGIISRAVATRPKL